MSEATIKDVITYNVRVITEAMKAADVHSVTITYAGGGDSGCVEKLDVDDLDGGRRLPEGEFTFKSASYDYRQEKYVVTEAKGLFRNLVEATLWLAIDDSGHSGWEDANGGGGSMTFTQDGGCILDHYDNVVHEEHSSHSY